MVKRHGQLTLEQRWKQREEEDERREKRVRDDAVKRAEGGEKELEERWRRKQEQLVAREKLREDKERRMAERRNQREQRRAAVQDRREKVKEERRRRIELDRLRDEEEKEEKIRKAMEEQAEREERRAALLGGAVGPVQLLSPYSFAVLAPPSAHAMVLQGREGKEGGREDERRVEREERRRRMDDDKRHKLEQREEANDRRRSERLREELAHKHALFQARHAATANATDPQPLLSSSTSDPAISQLADALLDDWNVLASVPQEAGGRSRVGSSAAPPMSAPSGAVFPALFPSTRLPRLTAVPPVPSTGTVGGGENGVLPPHLVPSLLSPRVVAAAVASLAPPTAASFYPTTLPPQPPPRHHPPLLSARRHNEKLPQSHTDQQRLIAFLDQHPLLSASPLLPPQLPQPLAAVDTYTHLTSIADGRVDVDEGVHALRAAMRRQARVEAERERVRREEEMRRVRREGREERDEQQVEEDRRRVEEKERRLIELRRDREKRRETERFERVRKRREREATREEKRKRAAEAAEEELQKRREEMKLKEEERRRKEAERIEAIMWSRMGKRMEEKTNELYERWKREGREDDAKERGEAAKREVQRAKRQQEKEKRERERRIRAEMEKEWERQLVQRKEREREEKEAMEYVAADRHSRRNTHSTATSSDGRSHTLPPHLPLALTASSLLPSTSPQPPLVPPPQYHAHGLLPSKEHVWRRQEEEKVGGMLPELVGVKAQRVPRKEEEKEEEAKVAVEAVGSGEGGKEGSGSALFALPTIV